MEEGVVGEIMKGPLRDVFDHKQLITDVSGAGNNWWVETKDVFNSLVPGRCGSNLTHWPLGNLNEILDM